MVVQTDIHNFVSQESNELLSMNEWKAVLGLWMNIFSIFH